MAFAKLPDGTIVHIKCARMPRKRCRWCTSGYVTKLCDFPITPRTGQAHTCDAGMCDRCATNVGPDKDYCPPHARYQQKQQSLFEREKAAS